MQQSETERGTQRGQCRQSPDVHGERHCGSSCWFIEASWEVSVISSKGSAPGPTCQSVAGFVQVVGWKEMWLPF